MNLTCFNYAWDCIIDLNATMYLLFRLTDLRIIEEQNKIILAGFFKFKKSHLMEMQQQILDLTSIEIRPKVIVIKHLIRLLIQQTSHWLLRIKRRSRKKRNHVLKRGVFCNMNIDPSSATK